MKMTIQLPEPVGRELLALPDREAFVSSAVVKALEVRRARRRPSASGGPGRARAGRRLDPSQERELGLPALNSREREIAWRHLHQEELQRRFAGQWVVLEGEEIVAHSEDAAEAVEDARAKGVAVPFVFYVDRPRPGVFRLGL
jgi:hypothetical protein